MRVYIAGPFTHGRLAQNIRNAVLCANFVRDHGHTPFCPHLFHLWDIISPRPYEDWLALCLEWLACCEAMIRLPGDSPGAVAEETSALSRGIPIYTDAIDFVLRNHP